MRLWLMNAMAGDIDGHHVRSRRHVNVTDFLLVFLYRYDQPLGFTRFALSHVEWLDDDYRIISLDDEAISRYLLHEYLFRLVC